MKRFFSQCIRWIFHVDSALRLPSCSSFTASFICCSKSSITSSMSSHPSGSFLFLSRLRTAGGCRQGLAERRGRAGGCLGLRGRPGHLHSPSERHSLVLAACRRRWRGKGCCSRRGGRGSSRRQGCVCRESAKRGMVLLGAHGAAVRVVARSGRGDSAPGHQGQISHNLDCPLQLQR